MTLRAMDLLRERAEWYALGRTEENTWRTSGGGDTPARFAQWVVDHTVSADGRTMHDRWLQWLHGGRHWHVVRHGEDEDPYVTYDVAAALDYAADELERLADAKVDEAKALVAVAREPHIIAEDYHAIAEDYHAAWSAREQADEWQVLAQNLANLARQHRAEPADRAPLYQDPATAPARLSEALGHILTELGQNGPRNFVVWDCVRDECRPRPFGENDGD